MTFSTTILPNFFILGAGRSGSTHLYHLLKQHPDIYLTNPTTAKILNALFPKSKFIVILRNPADRAYSLYNWMRRRGFEYLDTFEAALEAEESRYIANNFKENCPQYFYNYLYFRSSLYGEQLQRYFSLFSQNQFHILKYEDFIVDPINHLGDICQFLEIDQDFSPHLEVDKNAGRFTSRHPRIQYFLTVKLKKIRTARKIYSHLPKRLTMTNIKPLSEDTKNSFLERCSADLQYLYKMTGISFF
jgi:hypothetical protein